MISLGISSTKLHLLTTATPQYIVVEVAAATIPKQAQVQPSFRPSMGTLCHACMAKIHVSHVLSFY